MRRLRRTKIVATLGPASSDRRVIASLFEAGADVFRINMSHTTHARMRELAATIRDVETEHDRPIGILLDLQGPKLRVGTFAANPATLTVGETFTRPAMPSACIFRTPKSLLSSSPAIRSYSTTARCGSWPSRRTATAFLRAWRLAANCPTAKA